MTDISRYQTPSNEIVLLDTNIIYWMTYASARVFPQSLKPQYYQTVDYPEIVQELLNKNNTLVFSRLSIPELFHIVAKTEATLSGVEGYQKKDWLRRDGREIIVSEMKSVLEGIQAIATLIDSKSPPPTPDVYIEEYSKAYLDGYDIFIAMEMKDNNIKNILTDDIDYKSVADIHVITANPKASKLG